MGRLEETLALINEQGQRYKKHSNEWNVMNQLIDILAAQHESAAIVYEDLQVEEMKLPKLVERIIRKRMADPVEVMKEICDFYGIPCPAELPQEHWREELAGKPSPRSAAPSLLDLL